VPPNNATMAAGAGGRLAERVSPTFWKLAEGIEHTV
jgi:hypothetical protein